MSYSNGLEDGKKSQSPIWILSGILTWIGIILIYSVKKPNKHDFKNESDEYFEGFKKGVYKRRWSYFFGSIISLIFLSGFIQGLSQSTSNSITLIQGRDSQNDLVSLYLGIKDNPYNKNGYSLYYWNQSDKYGNENKEKFGPTFILSNKTVREIKRFKNMDFLMRDEFGKSIMRQIQNCLNENIRNPNKVCELN